MTDRNTEGGGGLLLLRSVIFLLRLISRRPPATSAKLRARAHLESILRTKLIPSEVTEDDPWLSLEEGRERAAGLCYMLAESGVSCNRRRFIAHPPSKLVESHIRAMSNQHAAAPRVSRSIASRRDAHPLRFSITRKTAERTAGEISARARACIDISKITLSGYFFSFFSIPAFGSRRSSLRIDVFSVGENRRRDRERNRYICGSFPIFDQAAKLKFRESARARTRSAPILFHSLPDPCERARTNLGIPSLSRLESFRKLAPRVPYSESGSTRRRLRGSSARELEENRAPPRGYLVHFFFLETRRIYREIIISGR